MIHQFAIVQAGCDVGEGSKVWQFASVLRGARLGPDSSVGACAVVDGSRIGPRARIGHGAQVHPGVVAGADLFVGPGAILCNDMWPWLQAQDFDLEALIQGRSISILCHDRVTIGAGAVILPGVRLGEGCVIGAGVVVGRNVAANALIRRDSGAYDKPAPQRRMRLVA